MNKVLMGVFLSVLSVVIVGGLGFLIYKDVKKPITTLPSNEQVVADDTDYKNKYTKLYKDYEDLVKANSDLQTEYASYKEASVTKEEYETKVKELEMLEKRDDLKVRTINNLKYSISNYKYQLNNNKVVFEYEYFNKNTVSEEVKEDIGNCITSIYVTYGEKRVDSTDENFTYALKEDGAVLHIEFTNKLDKAIKFGVMFNGQYVSYDGNASENGSSNFEIAMSDFGNDDYMKDILGNYTGDIYVINLRYIA